MPNDEWNTQETAEIRIRRFILYAKEGWSGESNFRAFTDSCGFTLDVTRDEEHLEELIRDLGEEPAYIVVHERSLLADPQTSNMDDVHRFMAAYYGMREAKPGKRTWLVLVKLPPSEWDWFFDCGDCIDMEVTEPFDICGLVDLIRMVERHRDNPDCFPEGWDE